MTADARGIRNVGGGVAVVSVTTDDAPYLRSDLGDDLKLWADALARDDDLRAVVLEGGDKSFCRGASRELLLSDDLLTKALPAIYELPRLVLPLPVPSVAAMAGHAIGGGFILGLWCDTAVLAEESLYGAN